MALTAAEKTRLLLFLSEAPSQSAVRSAIERALREEQPEGEYDYSYIADVFETDGYCVYSQGGKYLKRSFEVNADGTATLLNDAEEVTPRTEYDVIAATTESVREASVTLENPEDVSAAARAMKQEEAPTMKKSIIKAAKKKGAAYVAKLPKAWREAAAPKPDPLPQPGPTPYDWPEVVREACEIAGEYTPLLERAVAADGTALVKLIQPGWGSSGYYSAEVLKRDLPKVFKRGTEMFWNHPTAAEEAARPEGNLDAKAAVLQEDARFILDGPAGAGGYARAKVFEHYQPFVNEMGADLGTSIRGGGLFHMGEADGQKGKIIDALTEGRSVDFVTRPGAGGQVVQLFESAGRRPTPAPQETPMTAEEQKELKDLREAHAAESARNRKLAERLLLREAGDFITAKLAGAKLHEATKARIKAGLVTRAPLTAEGVLDEAGFQKLIDADVAEAVAELAAITGNGQVRGMGTTHESATETDPAKLRESLAATFIGIGMSKEAARVAAEGRAS